jgi:hypothetical protein
MVVREMSNDSPHDAFALYASLFTKNRYPLFSRDALSLRIACYEKPVSTFSRDALLFAHRLLKKPVSTFSRDALVKAVSRPPAICSSWPL